MNKQIIAQLALLFTPLIIIGADICNENNCDTDKIVTRSFDDSREIVQLYTRNLTVDGAEIVNGLLTVNGAISLNGRLLVNGSDIHTVIEEHATKIAGLANVAAVEDVANTVPPATLTAANGQIAIGSEGADPIIANITAGDGITITNGPGCITISHTGVAIEGNNGIPITQTSLNIVGTGTSGNNIITSCEGATLTIGIDAPISIANGGTNNDTTPNIDGVIYFDGTKLNSTTVGTAHDVLISNGEGNPPTFQSIAAAGAITSIIAGKNINITGTASEPIINFAGTTDHAVQIGNATNSLSSITPGTVGFVLTSNGPTADPSFLAPASPSITITGDAGGALTGNSFTFSGGSTGLTFNGAAATDTETLAFAGITANGGAISLATDATTSTVNVGTGAGVKTTTLGSNNSTSATTLQSGTGSLNVTATNGPLTINSGTGALGISTDGAATTISLATGGGAKAVTLGSTHTTSATIIQSGTGGLNITSTNSPLSINSGTGTVGISTDATTHAVNVGTGSGVKTTTLGSTHSTSTTTVRSGTGALNITATNGPLSINSGTGTVGISTDATNNTVNVGTGAGVKITTLGSNNSTSATTIQSGSGGIALNSNSGITLNSDGNLAASVATVLLNSPTVTTTLNSRLGKVTGTGFTTPAGSSLSITINNTFTSGSGPIFVSATNTGNNDAQMTISRTNPTAGSFTVLLRNNGTQALNGNFTITFWIPA